MKKKQKHHKKQQNNLIEVHEIPKDEPYTANTDIILPLPKNTFRLDIRAWTYDEKGLRTITSHYTPSNILELIKEHDKSLWEDDKVDYAPLLEALSNSEIIICSTET